jgi:pyruvate ferredoxin oxidoreductase gamma subunit
MRYPLIYQWNLYGVITVSLFGRGGQGIKTASRIIGDVAFASGNQVQDQPVYGAERRGAPISAYVRISKTSILERGKIDNSSLVVIADDSLLDSSTDNPLQTVTDSTVLMINSSKDMGEIRAKYYINNVLVVQDFTKLIQNTTHKSILGVAVSSATCKLLGFDFGAVEKALESELIEIGVRQEEMPQNIKLAKFCFNQTPDTKIETTTKVRIKESPMIEPIYHHPQISTCTITATGNSRLRDRGVWSNFKPVIEYDGCTKCMICYAYCPDSAFTIDSNGFPVIDYDACKGCNICKTECPPKVISLVKRENK